jgi:hypothetical protein
MSQQERLSAIKQANQLLAKQGYNPDGTPRKKYSKGQTFFERRIIMTPMGNRMR